MEKVKAFGKGQMALSDIVTTNNNNNCSEYNFSGLGFFNKPENLQTWDPQIKVPLEGFSLRTFTS